MASTELDVTPEGPAALPAPAPGTEVMEQVAAPLPEAEGTASDPGVNEPPPTPSFTVIEPLAHHRALAEEVGLGSELRTEIHSITPDGAVVIGTSTVFIRDAEQPRELSEAFRFTRQTGSVSLGKWPGVAEGAGGRTSLVHVVSRDGSTVIGMAEDSLGVSHPFLWTNSGGMVGFEIMPFARSYPTYYVSDDGAVIGAGAFGEGGVRSHRWTAASGLTDLGLMPGYQSSALVGFDARGLAFYGNGYGEGGHVQAFRWTEATGMQGLGFLPGYVSCSLASQPLSSLSHGGALLGACDDDLQSEIFVWTEQTGLTGLGVLDGYGSFQPMAVSADGNVVLVTAIADGQGAQAFRWTRDSGMQALDVAPKTPLTHWKGSMSKDGSVLVLASNSGGRARAFRWTEAVGLSELESLPGHSGAEVRAVSEDGSLVGGSSLLGGSASSIEGELAVVWNDEGEARSILEELEAQGVFVMGFVPHRAIPLAAGNGVYGEGLRANGSRLAYIAGLARRR